MKKVQINQIMTFLQVFRELNPDINVTTIMAFFEVAKGDGVTGRDLEVALDLNHATAARMLKYYDTIRNGKAQAGLGLFEVRLDPVDYRSKTRYLNPEGLKVLRRAEEALKGL